MRHEDFSMLEFRRYWDQGIPVIVSHVKFQGTWDPAYFAKAHKDKKVTLVNCETGKTKSCTVAAFFMLFDQPSGMNDGIWKLKVRLYTTCSFHLALIDLSLSRIGLRRMSSPRYSLNSSQTSRTQFRSLMLHDWTVC
jgi:hypothetical protein